MDAWTETDLAWELAEVAGDVFAERDRVEVYSAIGAGNSYTAIGLLLGAIERAGCADIARVGGQSRRMAQCVHLRPGHGAPSGNLAVDPDGRVSTSRATPRISCWATTTSGAEVSPQAVARVRRPVRGAMR